MTPTSRHRTSPDFVEPYQLLPPLPEGSYEELKEDIRRHGVRVAIHLDENGAVLDGHHRMKVIRELGITSYPRLVHSGMTEPEKREHALALNLHRRHHLTRPQRRELVMVLRELGWSTRRIGSSLGVSAATVLRDLEFVTQRGVASGTGDESSDLAEPPRIRGRDGKSYPSSRQRTSSVLVRTDREQQIATEAFSVLGERAPARLTDLRRLERLRRDQRSAEVRQAARQVPPLLSSGAEIVNCSIGELDVAPGSVDLIVTDPPYTQRAMDEGSFENLASFAGEALRPGGFVCALAPTMFLPRAHADLGAAESGLVYWWTFIITFERHPYQVRQRAVGSAFRPILVYRKKPWDWTPPFVMDAINGAGRSKDTDHPWQQAMGETDEIIRAFSRPAGVVVDPYCGTGTFGLGRV